MRAKEFIKENGTGSIQIGVADALPSTTVLPDLKSQDPYEQYRFGLALAAARAKKAGETEYDSESEFGEDMVIAAYSREEEETLQMALKLYGKNNSKKTISASGSKEAPDTYTQSPVQPQPKVSRKR